MPIHYNIEQFKLLEEIRKIEEAGNIVRFVVPESIKHEPGNKFGIITTYIIIFDAP